MGPSVTIMSAVTPALVVLGAQWGDEGKGKLVDVLAQDVDIVARCQGGNNAGHTIVLNGVMYDFHLVPSGLVNPDCAVLIGNGVVVHLPNLFQELDKLQSKGVKWEGRTFVSDRAHIVTDFLQKVDGLEEGERGRGSIGTTRKGIGPTYSAKASRNGLRIHMLYHFEEFTQKYNDLLASTKKRFPSLEHDGDAELATLKVLANRLKPMVVDSIVYLNKAFKAGKKILVEGANAVMLDLDFGSYPFVTSSSATVGGACTGLGIPPSFIGDVYGVVKAYTTRVGEGPFPTEQLNHIGEHLQKVGHEVGVTTGRKRRCGWLDAVVLKYSAMINGYKSINLTKLDILDQLDEVKIGVAYKLDGVELDSMPADLGDLAKVEVVYETLPGWKTDISAARTFDQLPKNAQAYVLRIQELVGVPVQWIGVGVARDAMVSLQ